LQSEQVIELVENSDSDKKPKVTLVKGHIFSKIQSLG
jgi:hypothetical protein